MNENLLIELPEIINTLLEEFEAPKRLKRHLQLVTKVADTITKEVTIHFQNLIINKNEVIFGAASHDIGKLLIQKELFEKGKKHEQAGFDFLIQHGFSKDLARFTKTHGQKDFNDLPLEDLLVILSDKIWKGKRVNELEEIIVDNISKKTQIEYWKIFTKMDNIISSISQTSEARLYIQKND